MSDQDKNTKSNESVSSKEVPAAKKQGSAVRLPSKPIVFGNQTFIKNGKKVKTEINKNKKSGHLLKKLTGK